MTHTLKLGLIHPTFEGWTRTADPVFAVDADPDEDHPVGWSMELIDPHGRCLSSVTCDAGNELLTTMWMIRNVRGEELAETFANALAAAQVRDLPTIPDEERNARP